LKGEDKLFNLVEYLVLCLKVGCKEYMGIISKTEGDGIVLDWLNNH